MMKKIFLLFFILSCSLKSCEDAYDYRLFSNEIKDVQEAIKDGCDINSKNECGCSALWLAVRKNNLEVAKLLINSGADINEKDICDETLLMQAEELNYNEMAELIKNKINNLEKLIPEFINAARKGKVKEVKEFIEQGININARDKEGFTALMRSAQVFIWSAPPYSQQIKDELTRKLEIVKILLEKKADFTFKDNGMHWTALKWARESKNQDAVNLLKAAGATE